ncbi:class I adenylate cyclase [Pseudomonas sp. URMO17WK12:I2]|uniref:class I adenylate cyclase n=1 Tax=Pseudomonas sp. URMO17WK12:I2 TaxID=1261623 RepID=UPI000DACCC44|nr:class I adenylate cyclase [Pseudomonas sp. URMO17WK12:I2]PZW50079.1 adenylate cyclase class 1 [Pseudomonas sp. URMO17WK12:I2]
MTRHLPLRPDIDDGIDRKVLTQLRARFMRINHGRLQRAMQALSSRQQRVLTLLPLLFHVNHPLLPGYVSAQTPAGLAGFEPSAELLAEAQRLTRSFAYKPPRAPAPTPIHGLFLMGSLGTLAQAEQSDMDLWVCHASELDSDAREILRRKCDLLQSWAAGQGAEAHFFLIDPERFRSGARDAQLTSDDCGTTQHVLLLDEFYRTAIWLAGRMPLWWLVPASDEHRYAHVTGTLLSKRFIRGEDVLDLGHLAQVPAGEFIGAGMWQLFKGIESPYKSALKLLLTEVYASEHPQVRCLSLRFKQAVYDGQLDLDELDPYVLIYRRLEEYLQARGETERLELVRRCLYLKVNKKISKPPRHREKSWQRLLLERLTGEWGWGERQLILLDSRSQWKVRQVTAERQALVNELNYSYRFLSMFARSRPEGAAASTRDMAVLGRRLYAAFERRAGKVEFINPGIAPDLGEDTLTLVHAPAPRGERWALYNGSLGAQEWPDFAPLRKSRSLIELLAWSHRNGVIDSATRLSLHPGDSDLSEFELSQLLGCLAQALPMPLASVSEAALAHPRRPTEELLLINVGLDPLKQHSQMNVHMTSERTDPLGYSGVRDNLVRTLDRITLNSWNELLVERYEGATALLDCLSDVLNARSARGERANLRVFCFCRNRAVTIAERVESLLSELTGYLDRGEQPRYLLQIARRYHLLDLLPGNVRHTTLDGLPALLEHLAQDRAEYSPLHLDHNALEGEDLALILEAGRPACVQVFYRLNEADGLAQITVLDECGAVWRTQAPFHNETSLLTPLHRFLQAMLYRRESVQPLENPQPVLEIAYYQLVPAAPLRAQRLEPRPVPLNDVIQPFYDVQAIVEPGSGARGHVSLFCNHREFSELEYGENLFASVARHILAQRSEEQPYPCYITDLDLSALLGERQPSVVHYLRYKASLEEALNSALRTL